MSEAVVDGGVEVDEGRLEVDELYSGDAAALSESRFGRGCGSQSGWWRIDRTRRIFLRVIISRKQRQKNHEIDGGNLGQAR